MNSANAHENPFEAVNAAFKKVKDAGSIYTSAPACVAQKELKTGASSHPFSSKIAAPSPHSVFADTKRCSCSMKRNMRTVFGLDMSITILFV